MELLKDRKIWERVRNNPDYKPLLDKLKEGYAEFCEGKEIPIIKFSDEMEFLRKGTRAQFERKYFLRRRQLTVYALLTLIYPEKNEYLESLQDIICEICNEYSWQVPAHRSQKNPNRRDGIALFSAETGLYLAELKQVLSDRLDPLVIDRITTEIDKRILTSFENELTGIERKCVTNNWASVLGCTIGLTFMYEDPARFEKVFERIERHMELYMQGISDDGATCEGGNYWNYGFSFFVMYYDTLRNYMNGRRAEVFKEEKVEKTARFFPALVLDKTHIVSFGDASSDGDYRIWLLHFLKKEYGIDMPPSAMGELALEECSSALRAFLYYNPEYDIENAEMGENYFEKRQLYTKRAKNYSFALNGGINDPEDNHNHNDIGSFIIMKNGKQVFCDLGSPQYTAGNFGATRYEVLNNSSLGHDVPIIDGSGQILGENCIGNLTVGDRISVDMKNVYAAEIGKLLRSFELSENSVTLTDEFDLGLDITERFVSEIPPTVKNGRIILENAEFACPDGWEVTTSVKTVTIHSGKERSAYFMDFKPVRPQEKFEINVNFI